VKRKSFNAVYIGRQKAEEQFRNAPEALDFGPLGRLPYFQSADNPEVMQKTIERLNWKDRLRDIDPPGMVREKHKDEKLKYRILTAIEAFTGLDFNHKNWRRIIRSRHPMKNPKVSLIIAVYKRADFLQRVLSSVENQTYRNFEVIVAEDDRAEGIRTLVDNRRESFPFPLIHVSQEDNGFRKNRILNEALRVSSGEYVVFIDGDCILHEKFIEEHVKNLGPDTCVFGRRAMLDERTTEMLLKKEWDNNLSFIRLLITKTRRLEDALYIPWLKTFRKTGVKGSNFSVNRDLIFKINGFDEEFERPYGGEDTDIERRLRLVGADIRCTKFKTIQYHLHHGGREGRTEEWEKYGKPFYQKKVDAGEWFCKNGIVPLKGK
jgi:glycosyltransferase involved in cell wall biosynthesis